MKQEVIVTGKTVEAAVASGADELGRGVEGVKYEVLEAPKKGFLGFGETPAKVKVWYEAGAEETALSFVRTVLRDMGIDATAELAFSEETGEYRIEIDGDEAGALIGHHGETLDALRYLVNLAANRREEGETRSYMRIGVDVGNYRAKREETLCKLARRMADRVRRYGKNVTLEPMNSYERRIIHSEVQKINGVTTYSIGADNNRRVVICLDDGTRRKNPGKSEDSED